jgi:amino acid transporter
LERTTHNRKSPEPDATRPEKSLNGDAAPDPGKSQAGLRRDLGLFDFTLLVVGAVIGADVYVVAAMGARFLGPAQLLAWVAAGFLAAVIALAFVQCAAICPEVGGSYAYTRAACGPLLGFLAGWTLYVGEWVALPVFPLAFVNYLGYFLPGLSVPASLGAKVLLVGIVTLVNVRGVRASGRANDLLTLVKLIPLALLILAGLAFVARRPDQALAHVTPFAPLGWGGFGSAILLIFWAYAGFELAVLPSGEVRDARRVLPRGLIVGMAIATLFYLLTSSAVVISLPWQVAASSPRPLTDAMGQLLTDLGLPNGWGLVVMSVGGLVSILGVYDVFTLSLARLSYAMARDGLFPPLFARIHSKWGTPDQGLIFQAVSAFVVAAVLDLTSLIAISVFFLGLCYLLTALSALRLLRQRPSAALHVPGLRPLLVLAALSGVYLSVQAPPTLIIIGVGITAAGLLIYWVRRSAWRRAADLVGELAREEQEFERWARRRERWLLGFVWRRRHESGSASPSAP